MGSPSDLREQAVSLAAELFCDRDDASTKHWEGRIHAALVSAQQAERERCVGIAREREASHRDDASRALGANGSIASFYTAKAGEAESIAAAIEGKEPK
jgi:hypothetical protein